MDDDIAAIVIDNDSDSKGELYYSGSDYAKVGADGVVIEIKSFISHPSSEWKICKSNTKIGLPY